MDNIYLLSLIVYNIMLLELFLTIIMTGLKYNQICILNKGFINFILNHFLKCNTRFGNKQILDWLKQFYLHKTKKKLKKLENINLPKNRY